MDLFNLLEDSLNNTSTEPMDEMEDFIDNVMLAADMAADSSGFFMITVTIENVDGKMAYVPRIFCTCADDDIATIIESEIVNIAAEAHRESSLEKLKKLLRKRSK
jgi:hypothetical protein